MHRCLHLCFWARRPVNASGCEDDLAAACHPAGCDRNGRAHAPRIFARVPGLIIGLQIRAGDEAVTRLVQRR